MFMQNLSTATERQSRSKSSKQKKKDNKVTKDDAGSSHVSDPATIVALLKQSGKMYRQEDQVIPRDVVMGYLNDMVRRLATTSNLEPIVAKHISEGKALYSLLVDYQQDVMEQEWCIEKHFGCYYLSMLTQIYPSDTLIHNAASRFMFMCMRSYINAMKLAEPLRPHPLVGHSFVSGDEQKRSHSNSEGESDDQQLNKTTFLEFLECCNAMNAMPETKKKLKSVFDETQTPPKEALKDFHQQVWLLCGVNPDFGEHELSKAPSTYGENQAMAMKINQFYLGMDLAVKEAMMSERERKAFYDQIPVVMHHMPHMFVFQQMMSHQHQHGPNCSHSHNHGHHHGHEHGGHQQIDPEHMKQLQEMMQTEDGKAQMSEFSSRMEAQKSSAAAKVQGFSPEQRRDYFENFAECDLMSKINQNIQASPLEKMQSFMSMSDSELESLLILQSIVAADQSSSNSQLDMTKLGNIQGLMQGMSINPQSEHGHGHNHSHSHSHGHNHAHGEHCQHAHNHSHGHVHSHDSTPIPDVASGKSASMDR